MRNLNIRVFRHTDLDALIRIAQISFADEYIAQGMTQENFLQQIRMVTRGRMLPFKIVTALSGIRWEMFVAEIEGMIVGCGGYLGRKKMELANLMVDPEFRRQGIGQALLEKRIQRLTELGYPFVTTNILAANRASLGNVRKQGFEIFDRYSLFEAPFPLPNEPAATAVAITGRPIQAEDKSVFEAIEIQIANPVTLRIQGSAAADYFQSFGERMVARFTSTQAWSRAFEKDGTILGFLTARTSPHQSKGTLPHPIVTDENLGYLPIMLGHAATWLTQLKKSSIQLVVRDEKTGLVEDLQNRGWVKTQSWVKLVKRLDESARSSR
jgi:ribosomal protein S18 acetylase RimI-like enzyme